MPDFFVAHTHNCCVMYNSVSPMPIFKWGAECNVNNTKQNWGEILCTKIRKTVSINMFPKMFSFRYKVLKLRI